MNGNERYRETLEREKRLAVAFTEQQGRPPRTNDVIEAEGGRWLYGGGIGWWALPTWYGSVGSLRSQIPMTNAERLQKVVNAVAPARWLEISSHRFQVEFFAYADSQDEASTQIASKVATVEKELSDLQAKVGDLTSPIPSMPPKPPPAEIVAYEE